MFLQLPSHPFSPEVKAVPEAMKYLLLSLQMSLLVVLSLWDRDQPVFVNVSVLLEEIA